MHNWINITSYTDECGQYVCPQCGELKEGIKGGGRPYPGQCPNIETSLPMAFYKECVTNGISFDGDCATEVDFRRGDGPGHFYVFVERLQYECVHCANHGKYFEKFGWDIYFGKTLVARCSSLDHLLEVLLYAPKEREDPHV